MSYFGTYSPKLYGNRFDELTDAETIAPRPARYVISGHMISHHLDTWLGTTEPTAVVGHCLYVFDIVR